MDPVLRTSLAIAVAVFIKALLLEWWSNFKAREEAKPVELRLRNGRYVAHSRLRRIQRILAYMFYLWLAYIAVLLVLLAAMKLGLWSGF